MSGSKNKFYVVWRGHRPGIYTTWPEAHRQIEGFRKARHKSFATREEAEKALQSDYWDYVNVAGPALKPSAEQLTALGVIVDSIAVDAACSGAPGRLEYQGVYVATGKVVFHQGPFEEGTSNVGEFLALVHALAWLAKTGRPNMAIYSDSANARSWLDRKTCRTRLAPTPENQPLFALLARAVKWLRENPITNPVLTWETRLWGENPADFGRK